MAQESPFKGIETVNGADRSWIGAPTLRASIFWPAPRPATIVIAVANKITVAFKSITRARRRTSEQPAAHRSFAHSRDEPVEGFSTRYTINPNDIAQTPP
jgi:hypothetical protein